MIDPPDKVRSGLPAGLAVHARCARCAASRCCRQISLEIDVPMRKKDFEDLLWFLAHEGVCIFVDDGAWYVSVEASCGFLATNGLCRIYEERPTICRTYSAEGCDRDEDTEYELHFQSFEELFTYLQARFPGFRGAGLEVLKQPLRMPGGAADQPVWLRGRRASSRV